MRRGKGCQKACECGERKSQGGKRENPSLRSLLPGRSEGLVSTWDPKSRTKVAGPRHGMREGGPRHPRVGVPNDGGYCARWRGGGYLTWLRPWPDPWAACSPACRPCPPVVPLPRGSRKLGPDTPTSSRPALSAPDEGAERCHFTCWQRVLRRSHGGGRQRAPGAGQRGHRGWAGARECGGPAVLTGPQPSTAALCTPPPPAPSPPLRLSAKSSAS